MAIKKINIDIFLKLSEEGIVLDVRSPEEFSKAHIPGALSLPLFTDDERKVIGTAYKQQSRQVAVKIGIGFFSERMKNIPEEVEKIIDNIPGEKQSISSKRILLHCWRGGMRSAAVAWLLNLYGFKVYTLNGGYKAFRRWANTQFEKKYNLKILGGYTGSGKTGIIEELKRKGQPVINLEALANHKGSAFGALGEKPQPAQEMFENLLAVELAAMHKEGRPLWIEDESRHIGTVGLPKSFWENMRNSSLYFLEIPFKERLQHIIKCYGSFNKEEIIGSITRIQKRLGGLETNNAIKFLAGNNTEACFSILLSYYDKLYGISLYKRVNIEALLNKIPCETVDIKNAQRLLLPGH